MRRLRRTFRTKDRAKHIRNMRQRDDFVLLGKVRLKPIEIDQTIIGQRTHIDMRADLFGQHLPRNDIAVMLELRQHDPVARFQVRWTPALRDEIDTLGRAANEDYFVWAGCADKSRHAVTRCLERHCHVG